MSEKLKQSTTRDRILDAALQTFVENGYAGATTRLIASNAGVTEVTLFRHFQSKEALYLETAQEYSKITDLLLALDKGKRNDLTHDLLHFGQVIMDTFLERQGIIRLVISEAHHHTEVIDAVAKGPQALHRFLTEYFQEQIDDGKVRAIESNLIARHFLNMFLALILSKELLGDFPKSAEEISYAMKSIVEIFVNGIKTP